MSIDGREPQADLAAPPLADPLSDEQLDPVETGSNTKRNVLRVTFTVLFAVFTLGGAVLLAPKENRIRVGRFLGLEQAEKVQEITETKPKVPSSSSRPPAIQPNPSTPDQDQANQEEAEKGPLEAVKSFFSNLHAKTSKHYQQAAEVVQDLGDRAKDVKENVQLAKGDLVSTLTKIRRLPMKSARYFWAFIGIVTLLVVVLAVVFVAIFYMNPAGKELIGEAGSEAAAMVDALVAPAPPLPPQPLIPRSLAVFLGLLAATVVPVIIVIIYAAATRQATDEFDEHFFNILNDIYKWRLIVKFWSLVLVAGIISGSIAMQLAGSDATMGLTITLLVLTLIVYGIALAWLGVELLDNFFGAVSDMVDSIFAKKTSRFPILEHIFRLVASLAIILPIATLSMAVVTAFHEFNLVALFNFTIDSTLLLALHPLYLFLSVIGGLLLLLALACLLVKPIRAQAGVVFENVKKHGSANPWPLISSICLSVLLTCFSLIHVWVMVGILLAAILYTLNIIKNFKYYDAKEKVTLRAESANGFFLWIKSGRLFTANFHYVEIFVVSFVTILGCGALLSWTAACIPVFLSFLGLAFCHHSATEKSKHIVNWRDDYFKDGP